MQLNGQVGDAEPGIHLVGGDDGGGRAGIDTAPAVAAMVVLWGIRGQG